jgi:hypothetical protein
MIRLARVGILAALAVAIPVFSPAFGDGGGGRVELESVVRVYDSRLAGGNYTGEKVTSAVIGSGVFTLVVFYPAGPGTAVVHPCGEPPPPGEATFRLADQSDLLHAKFATAEKVCLTSTVPVHVIVDRDGTVSATPEADRSQYIPLASPTLLWDAETTRGGQVININRPAGLSAQATAAVISIESLGGSEPGYLTAYSCAADMPLRADLIYSSRFARAANIAYVPLGQGDDLCVYVLSPTPVRVRLVGELSTTGPNPALLPPSWRYTPSEVPAPSLRPIVPERVLDTRVGVGRPGTSKVEADEVVELAFGALIGPQTTAVVLNVATNQPESDGFVTAWPCGGDRPVVSNLNFVAGETVANLVVSKLGPGGSICLSGISRTHLVADLNGTYETDGGLLAVPVDPQRILDSRKAIGVATTTKLPAGEVLTLQVIDGTIVPNDAGAATVNITVTEPEDAGYVTVYPCDKPRPTASNINYMAGQTVGNLVTAKLSTDGRLCLFSLQTTHLVGDIAAWYGPEQSAGLIDLPPERILDTRNAIGTPTTTKVGAGEFIVLQVGGRGGVAGDADAMVMNLAVTEPEGDGFATAWPCDRSMPTVSNVNYAASETNPNLATVKLSATGTVCLFTLARAHLIADVAGYLTDQLVEGQELSLQ